MVPGDFRSRFGNDHPRLEKLIRALLNVQLTLWVTVILDAHSNKTTYTREIMQRSS